jgi:phytanoyl-CoA hydroxylase
VIHLIRSDAEFQPTGVGYIYGRYKMFGSTKMDETFFPITYTKDGYRSPMLKEFCTDAFA